MPQSIPKGLRPEHILKALTDLDAGIEHPFGPSTGYVVVHRGKRYAPKAVIGVAFRQLTGEILHHSRFSGGEAPGQANSELRRLGFTVVEKVDQEELPAEDCQSKAWSENEIGYLIADYFDMLQLDLRGERYNKAEHNKMLRERLSDRTKSSLEFKHQNVSAVLLSLGLPYIDGYKPARHFQRSLIDGVRSYLDTQPDLLRALDQVADAAPETVPKLGRVDRLFESPPNGMVLPETIAVPWRERQGCRIDYARREAANRRLGQLGEQFAVEMERQRLRARGRDDLAQKVEWISQTSGDGVGFDVLSFDDRDESERLIEVKTTTQGKNFPFYVTANEVSRSEVQASQYYLYRLFRFTREPRLFVLYGALSERCTLDPVSYRAAVAG